jgi:hypothetical protein
MTVAEPAAGRRRRPLLVALAVGLGTIGILVLLSVAQLVERLPPTPTPDVSSPVEGVVVSVEATGLNSVRGFVLRVSEAFAFEFELGLLENPTEFPPGHLAEHQATSEPVRVYFRTQDGDRVVYRLEDAGTSPAPSSSDGI